jgi:hypothetical protein
MRERLSRRCQIRLLSLSIAVVLMLMLTGTAAAAGFTHRDFGGDGCCCPRVHATQFLWLYNGVKWRSSSYDLSGFHAKCSFVNSWVRRLTKQPYTGPNKKLRLAPAGWQCWSDKRPLDKKSFIGATTVLAGVCQNRAKTSSFIWTPDITDAVPTR